MVMTNVIQIILFALSAFLLSSQTNSPALLVQAQIQSPACGCDECTDEILDTYAGPYTCGARIEYLIRDLGYTEVEACRKVSSEEFPTICGPACDPDRCDKTNAPINSAPTRPPVPAPSSLYCFPDDDGSRVTYLDMWDGSYKVQVKEGNICGPGDNRFSRNTVSRSGDELTLQFKKNGGVWEASEVRIVIPDETPYKYGDYAFHVKSVAVKNSAGIILSDILPKEIVLGLFTWDPTDDYSVHQNWNHEVDIEISRWNSDTNADTQFLVQPPGYPQMYRFYSGLSSNTYQQSNHRHSFKWLPNEISWLSTAGGGHSHAYTTKSAILGGGIDYVQCLPADVEIRLNLWSVNGMGSGPSALNNDDYVEVIIDNFTYEEDGIEFAAPGDYCSKHCQCEAVLGCSNGQCISMPSSTASPSTEPSSLSTPLSTSPSMHPSPGPTLNPTVEPHTPLPTVTFLCTKNQDCKDNDVCTSDKCMEKTGQCKNKKKKNKCCMKQDECVNTFKNGKCKVYKCNLKKKRCKKKTTLLNCENRNQCKSGTCDA